MNRKKIIPVVVLAAIIVAAAVATFWIESGVELTASTGPTSFATQHIRGVLPPGWELVSAFTTAGEGALRFEGPNNSVAIAYYAAIENENATENDIDEIAIKMVEVLENLIENSQEVTEEITISGVSDLSVKGATAKKIEVVAEESTRTLYIWLRPDIGEGIFFNVIAETPDPSQLSEIDALVASLEYALIGA